MRIAIHHNKISYSEGLVEFCRENNIDVKLVNAYSSKIVTDLEDCDAFFWHIQHNDPKDVLFARQLLFSLELSGKKVFPNFKTCWHFDDKVGQKYLLESFELPLIPSNVAYSKADALNLIENHEFPIVFKLRGGAGSYNVSLIKTKSKAKSIINKSFGKGFRQFNPLNDINYNLKKLMKDGLSLHRIKNLLKSTAHLLIPYKIEQTLGNERGYFYFQTFIPNCTFDYRVQFIGDISYAMKRYVRKGDFRASGGGNIDYDGSKIPMEVIKLAKRVKETLNMQTLAIDILPFGNEFVIAEVSFAFAIDEGECDFGYYDSELNWINQKFNPYEFMIKLFI